MQTVLRTRGKAVALIVPGPILKQAGVGAGTAIDVRVENGSLVITPLAAPTGASA